MPKHISKLVFCTIFVGSHVACAPVDEPRPRKEEAAQPVAVELAGPADPGHALENLPEYYQSIPDGQPLLHHSDAGEPGTDGWCVARPDHANFSVLLPGKFREVTAKSATSTGGVSVMHTVATRTAQDVEFLLLHSELFGTRPTDSISLAESMLREFKAKRHVVKSTKTVLANLPADRINVRARGTYADMIFITTPSNEYMLAVQSHLPINNSLQKDIERFFESFEILPPETKEP